MAQVVVDNGVVAVEKAPDFAKPPAVFIEFSGEHDPIIDNICFLRFGEQSDNRSFDNVGAEDVVGELPFGGGEVGGLGVDEVVDAGCNSSDFGFRIHHIAVLVELNEYHNQDDNTEEQIEEEGYSGVVI